MKKCFKLLGLVLLATTLTIAYTSCGGDDDDTTTTTTPDPGDDPGPGPGPGPGPDPEPNPFEGMEAGQVRAMFSGDGSDTIYTKIFRNYYAEHPSIREVVLWSTRAKLGVEGAGNENRFYPPYYSCLASLDSSQGFEFYCEYYTNGGWQDVIVTYQSGRVDTHSVGNYVYVGSLWGGPITVDKVSYNSLRKVLTAKVVIPLAKTADIISDAAGHFNPAANPEIQNLTILFYKVSVDDQFPTGTKNLLGNDKFFGTKLKSKIRVR